MTYEYRVISTSREAKRQSNDQNARMALTDYGLESILNELAAEGFRFAGVMTWGARRGDQALIMERETQRGTPE